MKFIFAIALALGLISSAAYAGFSPSTTSPEVNDISQGEQCVKETGKLKCRWDGDCVQVGNTCVNCIGGYHWDAGLGACYSCPSGTGLKNVGGSWTCE